VLLGRCVRGCVAASVGGLLVLVPVGAASAHGADEAPRPKSAAASPRSATPQGSDRSRAARAESVQPTSERTTFRAVESAPDGRGGNSGGNGNAGGNGGQGFAAASDSGGPSRAEPPGRAAPSTTSTTRAEPRMQSVSVASAPTPAAVPAPTAPRATNNRAAIEAPPAKEALAAAPRSPLGPGFGPNWALGGPLGISTAASPTQIVLLVAGLAMAAAVVGRPGRRDRRLQMAQLAAGEELSEFR
jgi:hypothetical protein